MLLFPSPGRDLPLQMLEHAWHKQLLLVASLPGGSSFSCSFPFLSALHSNLDVGLPAAGALSSASLPRKMDFLQNFPSHFEFLTAALLLPLSHSQHSVAVCAVCPHAAKPISVHYLPLKKNPQTTKVQIINNKINVFSG